ncbi:replication protein A 32 kDa subunit isoform X2 [Hydra vulgaris]|uniref:Replication protein A 32 kDa subunit isoform X2 n=1 Tax=Hydra vulgaris TaxID=6087 RepID=A0ABM4CZA7_HYDVU
MNYQGFHGNYQGGDGGFMSPGVGSPAIDSSQKKKNRSQTLLPITAAIFHKAEYNSTEDVFRHDDIDIHQVTIVGVIREVQEAATNISYKIDDMTGDLVSVRKWIDAEDPSDNLKRSECREDTYVRVVGNMKSFNDGQMRSVMAFSLVPVKDFDEISFHFLDVIYANLSLKKAPNLSIANNNTDAPLNRFGNDPLGGGFNDAGLTGHNKVVFNYISACTAEQGISIMELKQKTKNIGEVQLRNSLEWLSNEGHIYSTIDDDHFRSTSN